MSMLTHPKGTTPYIAEKIAEAVKAYHDQTARKHECAGFDCVRCAFNCDRFEELTAEILTVLESEIEEV